MPQLKVLFADDQVPEESLPGEEMKATLKRQHPEWPDEFIDGFAHTRQMVQVLRDASYDVTVARTFSRTLQLIRQERFDIAVIDLTWYGDASLRGRDWQNAGWKISTALEEADKSAQRRETPQIIHSNRFRDDATLSIEAANRGKLPLYKGYDRAGYEALKATVKFIEHEVLSISPNRADDAWQILKQHARERLEQQKRLFNLCLGFIIVSCVCVVVGILLSFFSRVTVGTLTGVVSVFSSLLSLTVFRLLNTIEGKLRENQEQMMTELRPVIPSDGPQ
jgi:hypothetical protein